MGKKKDNNNNKKKKDKPIKTFKWDILKHDSRRHLGHC